MLELSEKISENSLLSNYNENLCESKTQDEMKRYGQTSKTPYKYGNLTRKGDNWYIGSNCKT